MWNLIGENAGDLQGGGEEATLLQEKKTAHPLQIHLQCTTRASKVFEKGGAEAQQILFSKISLSAPSANDPTSRFPTFFSPIFLSEKLPNIQFVFPIFFLLKNAEKSYFLKILLQFSFLKILKNPIVMLCILCAALGAVKGESTFNK